MEFYNILYNTYNSEYIVYVLHAIHCYNLCGVVNVCVCDDSSGWFDVKHDVVPHHKDAIDSHLSTEWTICVWCTAIRIHFRDAAIRTQHARMLMYFQSLLIFSPTCHTRTPIQQNRHRETQRLKTTEWIDRDCNPAIQFLRWFAYVMAIQSIKFFVVSKPMAKQFPSLAVLLLLIGKHLITHIRLHTHTGHVCVPHNTHVLECVR